MTDFLESSYPSGSERSQFFCSWIRHITVNYKKWNRQDIEREGTIIKYTALLCILSLILNIILFIRNFDFSDGSFISLISKVLKTLWCYTYNHHEKGSYWPHQWNVAMLTTSNHALPNNTWMPWIFSQKGCCKNSCR